jgi:fatty acid desaturase
MLRSESEVRHYLEQRVGPQLAQLRHLDPSARAQELAFFFALAGLSVTLIRADYPTLGILGLACVYNAAVLLIHEGIHGLLSRSRSRNLGYSVLLGVACLCSFTSYRVLHQAHHKHLGGPGDPDDYYAYTRSKRLFWMLQWMRLLCATFVYLPILPLVAWRRASSSERRQIVVESLLMVFCYTMLFQRIPLQELKVYWLYPLLLVGFFTNLRGLVQHGLCEREDSLLASRSIHPHPLVARLMLHENLHLEHHLFPEIPSYHLPQLHQLIDPLLPRALRCRSYFEVLLGFFRATPGLDERPIGGLLDHR